MFRSLIQWLRGGAASQPHVYYIGKLEPGKYRLPDTAETREAQVVYSQSDVPYPVWLQRYKQR